MAVSTFEGCPRHRCGKRDREAVALALTESTLRVVLAGRRASALEQALRKRVPTGHGRSRCRPMSAIPIRQGRSFAKQGTRSGGLTCCSTNAGSTCPACRSKLYSRAVGARRRHEPDRCLSVPQQAFVLMKEQVPRRRPDH